MSQYLRNRWVRIAIALFALGSVPLGLVALLATLGVWTAPAMFVPGLLWVLTFWPAVFFLAAGIVQVRGQRR
jgi:hypothetical protein